MPETVPIGGHALPPEPFAAATAQVNEWRGRCLDALTRVETIATECLAAMAAIDGRGSDVELPHLIGQRLEALATAIGADGPFRQEGGIAAAKLDQFRRHLALRNMLCHGVGKVTLDLQGRWTVVFCLVTLRAGSLSREQLALTKAEAADVSEDLIRTSRELCSRLSQVRFSLRR